MRPIIGITCSTLLLDDLPGVPRAALPVPYVDCVSAAGGLPFVIPNVDAERARDYLRELDGLLLSGGCDMEPHRYGQEPHPDLGKVNGPRDRLELALARQAYEMGLPIFAICRGAQVLNVAYGGTLLQHVPGQVPNALEHDQGKGNWDALCHDVHVERETRLRAISGTSEVKVNSFHHQAADRIADGFVVTARAPDGVVEGLEAPDHPFCVAVQWHPERRSGDSLTKALFGAFLFAARGANTAEAAPVQ